MKRAVNLSDCLWLFLWFICFKDPTCVCSAKKSVSFLSAAAGRAPPADESIHNCSTDTNSMCEFMTTPQDLTPTSVDTWDRSSSCSHSFSTGEKNENSLQVRP